MPVIKSISGIRGTIGDRKGEDLTKEDIVLYTKSFVLWLQSENRIINNKIVVGRDARISGQMVEDLVLDTLIKMGLNVVCLGLSTTPTVEIAVPLENADAGIIITASHNPKNWNALKFFNDRGEFLSENDVKEILDIESNNLTPQINNIDLGKINDFKGSFRLHIDEILNLKHVNPQIIRDKKFKIVVDGINSSGGIIIPMLLEILNAEVIKINCVPDGNFAHDPEPLDKNLSELKKEVLAHNADLGIAVDPDVDRLVFVSEKGETLGEENTLISCADYILSKESGPAVTNLSSSMGLRDVCTKYNVECFSSKVGEINVVEKMKAVNAIIGGEGNGGIIYPESHYGRDALVGVGLLLTSLALKDKSISKVFEELPKYHMLKEKINIDANLNFNVIKIKLKSAFQNYSYNETDGLKIENKSSWIHVRKSNTEPIIRIYIESKQAEISKSMFNSVKKALS